MYSREQIANLADITCIVWKRGNNIVFFRYFLDVFVSFKVTFPLEPKKCANLYFQKNDSAKTIEILAR